MSRTQSEADRDREEELQSELYTMLDAGLGKKSSYRLVEIIKELAVIAVREQAQDLGT